MEKTEVEWVRSLAGYELSSAKSAETGSDHIAVSATVVSRRPVSQREFRSAVMTMYRAAPNLQVCIDNREKEPWFRKISPGDLQNLTFLEEPTLDLALRHHSLMLNQDYVMKTGPLWYLKVIHVLEEKSLDQRKGQSQYHKDHSVYVLVFGFFHPITDGISNFLLIGFMLAALEEQITEGSFHLSKPNFKFTSTIQTDILTTWEIIKMVLNPWSKQRQMRNYESFFDVNVVASEDLVLSQGEESATNVVMRNLDVATSSKFAHRCKSEGVTVHSGFSALLNLAHACTMGRNSEMVDIKSEHYVNLRRYWWGDASSCLGVHSTPFFTRQDTDPKILTKGRFWDYAVQIHQKLQKDLENNTPCKWMGLFHLTGTEDSNIISPRSPPFLHYETSNMGRVDKFFPFSVVTDSPEPSKNNLQLLDIVQSTSVHNSRTRSLINVLSLRGKLNFCIDYNTSWMNHEAANELADTIVRLLKDSIS